MAQSVLMLDLNDLLAKSGLKPADVVVMRHRPTSKALREQLPWMAAEKHDLFNAFQSSHTPSVERMLTRAKHLVSLIGDRPGYGLFVGVYDVADYRMISPAEFAEMEVNQELVRIGTKEPEDERTSAWFDLRITPLLAEFKGRISFRWPPPERSWARWAGNGSFLIDAIHEESRLVPEMPEWRKLVVPLRTLGALPASWRHRLSQWRGIYFIFDTDACKGYVGSAYGRENILGRWEYYASTIHGGNELLRQCKLDALHFSVLQLVGPDADEKDVLTLEAEWKARLHTRAPHGLNAN